MFLNSIKLTLAMFDHLLCVFEISPHTAATEHFRPTNQLSVPLSNCEPVFHRKQTAIELKLEFNRSKYHFDDRMEMFLPQTAAKLPTILSQRSVCHRCNETFCVFSHNQNRISALRARTKLCTKRNKGKKKENREIFYMNFIFEQTKSIGVLRVI